MAAPKGLGVPDARGATPGLDVVALLLPAPRRGRRPRAGCELQDLVRGRRRGPDLGARPFAIAVYVNDIVVASQDGAVSETRCASIVDQAAAIGTYCQGIVRPRGVQTFTGLTLGTSRGASESVAAAGS